MMTEFLALACMVALVFGAIDYLWQKFEHLRRNRMSHEDLKREFKESDGDPHMRARRRHRAREIATRHMLREVASADVVVINPQHYAVALKWNRARRTAPICVAKGVDQIAMRIREQASLAGVPLHSDPATARALYATIGLGEAIHPEHYMAIAAAIRFADGIRKRKKGLIG
jgi:flagellar biosynthetic protein FlhB